MNEGSTHWEGCWREHHECAVAEIERLHPNAERYEWLCANAYVWGSHFSSTQDDQVEDAALWIKGSVGMDQEGINVAIDAAMKP